MLYFFPPVETYSGNFLSRSHLKNGVYVEGYQGKQTLHDRGTSLEISMAVFRSLSKLSRITIEGVEEKGVLHVRKPWACRVVETSHQLPDLVPFDGLLPEYFYQRKIGIFGAPGSGKTTLARSLCTYISTKMGIHADTPYEYASTFIARHGIPAFEDQIWIMLEQWKREEDISRHKQVLISDCPHPLSYLYLLELGRKGKGTDKTIPWSQEKALQGMREFDTKIFLPLKPKNVRKDGIRYHNPEQSQRLNGRIKGFLDDCGGDYISYDYEKESIEDLVKTIFSLNDCTFASPNDLIEKS